MDSVYLRIFRDLSYLSGTIYAVYTKQLNNLYTNVLFYSSWQELYWIDYLKEIE